MAIGFSIEGVTHNNLLEEYGQDGIASLEKLARQISKFTNNQAYKLFSLTSLSVNLRMFSILGTDETDNKTLKSVM